MSTPVRPTVRRSAPALNTAIARRRTRRFLVAPGVRASRNGMYLRISRTAVNFSDREDHQERQQLAQRRLRPPAAKEDVQPPVEAGRAGRGPGQHGDHDQDGPVQRDVVIAGRSSGVATATISPSLPASAAAIAALTFSWSSSLNCSTHHPPEAPPPPNDRRRREAAEATSTTAAATEASEATSAAPAATRPRDRLSSLRPHRTTHGSMPSPRRRLR